MAIIINIDVMMAKRKMSLGDQTLAAIERIYLSFMFGKRRNAYPKLSLATRFYPLGQRKREMPIIEYRPEETTE